MRYSYTCDKCGATFEEDLLIKDRDGPCKGLCGICDGVILRDVGNGGFKLLGRGWASDNYSTYLGDTPAFKRGYGG